jgi:hypothetical protein
MKQFEISEELANKILQYLISKPYIEVTQLINEIQQLKLIEDKTSKPKL